MSMQASIQPILFRAQAATAERLRAHLLGLAPACRAARRIEEARDAVVVPRGLVDIRRIAPEVVALPAPAWSEAELRFLVRPEVAERLREAAGVLPANLRLGFWEGLRPVSIQQALWEAGFAYLRSSYPDKGG